MKNKLSKILFTCLAACMAAASVLFAACDTGSDGGDPATDGYIITLLYPDGSPVQPTDTGITRRSVGIQLSDADGNDVGGDDSKSRTYTVIDTNGTVTIEYTPGTYYIDVINCPAGYTYTRIQTSADRAKYTVTLTNASHAYTVSVKYPDGTAASGIGVTLTDGDTDVASATTGADGTATTDVIPAGEYTVNLDLPNSYACKTVTTQAGSSDVEITLTAVNVLALTTPLTEDEKEPWLEHFNSTLLTRLEPTADSYTFTAEVPANGEVFYAVVPEESGTYRVLSMADNYSISFYGSGIDEAVATMDTSNGTGMYLLSLTAGERYIFSCATADKEAGSYAFLVSKPIPTAETVTAKTTGTYTLNYNGIDTAILHFNPSESGIYTISSDNTQYVAKLECYSYANRTPLYDNDGNILGADDICTTAYENEVQTSYVGNTYVYHIIITPVNGGELSYPATLDVKITRTGDASEERTIETTEMTTENTTAFGDQSGTLTWIALDGTQDVVYNETDGFYHMGTADGPVLVVAVNRNIRDYDYNFSTIEYLLYENEETTISDEKQRNELTLYDTEDSYIRWNYSEFVAAYKLLANSDGVYGVNGEWKLFLERFAACKFESTFGQLSAHEDQLTAAEGYEWLFACGYYAE